MEDNVLRNPVKPIVLLAVTVIVALTTVGLTTPSSDGYWRNDTEFWPVHEFNEETGEYLYRTDQPCGLNEHRGIDRVLVYTVIHTIYCGRDVHLRQALYLGWHPGRLDSINFLISRSPDLFHIGLLDARRNGGVAFLTLGWDESGPWLAQFSWSLLFCDAIHSCNLILSPANGIEYVEHNA